MAEEHRIELIPREIEEARKRVVLVRSLRVLGLGLLTLTVMVTAALFSVVQAQKSSLRNIQQQVAAKKAALADLAARLRKNMHVKASIRLSLMWRFKRRRNWLNVYRRPIRPAAALPSRPMSPEKPLLTGWRTPRSLSSDGSICW